MNSLPGSLAFDFDGILCNGLKEYFQTAWRVYCKFWTVSDTTPPEGLAERFYKLRPVVEVGWEMPVVIRAAIKGFSDDEILRELDAEKSQGSRLKGWEQVNQEIY